ncbi:hypothetical protein QBC37DRAFT_138226 [Rhypophila decipiens]|uniref:Uncharacterized protein n=1 Tax=Rhypophila decipiens TaxID=261697 RepID=A0AAN6YAC1_9PEZI|nr:hypothetical protein QBC37DRAFT_138226 [Rhypophila decipiens]
MENTPEAESFTHPTPMFFQPTTGFSALTTNNTANPVLHGFGSSSTPTPAPGRPDLPDFDEQNAVVPAPAATSPTKRKINLRYDHEIDQAIYNPSWVQKESGIYPLGDQDKLVEVETGNGPMTISYHAATRSIFLSTVREDSDSSKSDEFVVSPAPPKQLAAGYSFQSDSSPSKKRSRNEGSGRSRTPNTTLPDKRARIETDEDVIFDDLDITANPTDRDSPTLGEGVPDPVVRQTTAPVPTVSGYGVPPPILGSGNWELPVPRTLSGETLLEMEQSLLAWLAVVQFTSAERPSESSESSESPVI